MSPCLDSTSLRLLNGPDTCSGTSEVLYKGSWKKMCHRALDNKNAMAMCRQLNCGNIVNVAHELLYIKLNESMKMIGIKCKGSETSLEDCNIYKYTRCYDYLPPFITCSSK